MSADDLFAEAVEWTRPHIRRGMVDAPTQTPQHHAALMLHQDTFEPDVDSHIRFAERDPWSFKVVVHAAAECLRAGKLMPDGLVEFTADVLDGTRKRPKRRHDRRAGWHPEPMALGFLVSMVANRFGIKPYKTSNAEAITAARVVEKALAVEKRARSLSTVEAAFKKFAKATKSAG
jgi:hypothetical protein